VALRRAGSIRVHDTDIAALPEPRRDRFRAQHIGYVFQTFNLLSAFSAIENVMLSMMFASAIPKSRQRQRARDLLSQLGLGRASLPQAAASVTWRAAARHDRARPGEQPAVDPGG